MEIVGVDLSLVGSHRRRPAVQRRGDRFHIEVTAFDDTHLDPSTASCHTFFGKLQQLGLEAIGIGQISLNHDTGRIVQELGLGKSGEEHADGHVEVLVFFHVEVDKLRFLLAVGRDVRIVDGCLVERGHAAYELREGLLVVQRVGLCIDTRNFHRDVVDVGLFECLDGVVIALVSLFVSEYHLAEQVDVLPDVLLIAF